MDHVRVEIRVYLSKVCWGFTMWLLRLLLLASARIIINYTITNAQELAAADRAQQGTKLSGQLFGIFHINNRYLIRLIISYY